MAHPPLLLLSDIVPTGLPTSYQVLLTRSKSQRDRLVQRSAQLAQGVEAAAAEVACELGFPRTPSTAQVTGLPMTRSAASELAITLNDMMT